MCEGHAADDKSAISKLMLRVYTRWVDDTLDFYLFLGRMGKVPLIGGVIRFFAGQYGKYLHGGRVATVEECLLIIAGAKRFTVADCACRKKFGKCEKPLKTCLGIDTGAEVFEEVKNERFITREEAVEVIKKSYDQGLIRSVTHCVTPNLYVICNCCTCCCVPYRLRSEFGIENAVEKGNLVARLDSSRCRRCFKCVESCPEKAIFPDDGSVDTRKCLGCGLCLRSCEHRALTMVLRVGPTALAIPGTVKVILMYAAFFLVVLPLAVTFKLNRSGLFGSKPQRPETPD